MEKTIVDKIKDAIIVAQFVAEHHIRPEAVKLLHVEGNTLKAKPALSSQVYTIAELGVKSPTTVGFIVPDQQHSLELAAFCAKYSPKAYEYDSLESVPKYANNWPVRAISHDGVTMYVAEMAHGYELSIYPYLKNGFEEYRFAVSNRTVESDRVYISPGWDKGQIEDIYNKLSNIDTIPVLKDKIVASATDRDAEDAIARYMEEMVHPVKSATLNERWGDSVINISLNAYKAIHALEPFYGDYPDTLQVLAETIIEQDETIKEQEQANAFLESMESLLNGYGASEIDKPVGSGLTDYDKEDR